MDAPTAFDREPVRVRRHPAVDIVPLTQRTWFRLVASAIILSWVVACVFMSTWLAT